MKSYLFLDVDGVLNHRDAPHRGKLAWLDPRCILRLSTIVERVDAAIVVSSTWRLRRTVREFRELLGKRGLVSPHRIIGATADISVSLTGIALHSPIQRGVEIVHWLELYADLPCGVAIVDDDADMWVLGDRLVRTDFCDGGLKDEHVSPLVDLLRTPLEALPSTALGALCGEVDGVVGNLHRQARRVE